MALRFACGFDGVDTADLGSIMPYGRDYMDIGVGGGVFGGNFLKNDWSSSTISSPFGVQRYMSFWLPKNTNTVLRKNNRPGLQHPLKNFKEASLVFDNKVLYVGVYGNTTEYLTINHPYPTPYHVEIDWGTLTENGRVLIGGVELFNGMLRQDPSYFTHMGGGSNPPHNFKSSKLAMDDLILWDEEDVGDGWNTFPKGPIRIQLLQNSGAGDLAEWTPNSSTNWEDTTAPLWMQGEGVQTSTDGAVDLHKVEDVAWNPVKIHGMIHRIRGSNLGQGIGKIQLQSRLGSSDQLSPEITLPAQSSVTHSHTITKSPDGTPLSRDTINDIQYGYKSLFT